MDNKKILLKESIIEFEKSSRLPNDYINLFVKFRRVISSGSGLLWDEVLEILEEVLIIPKLDIKLLELNRIIEDHKLYTEESIKNFIDISKDKIYTGTLISSTSENFPVLDIPITKISHKFINFRIEDENLIGTIEIQNNNMGIQLKKYMENKMGSFKLLGAMENEYIYGVTKINNFIPYSFNFVLDDD